MSIIGTHNSPNSLSAKLTMRRHVLAQVSPARVFDAYCGPGGERHAGVWRDAAASVGCDRAWRVEDGRRRYAADTLLVLQSIDLSAFNVFDVDAFGDPWPAAIKVLRRRWEKAEVGALCVTDGSSMKTRWGAMSGPAIEWPWTTAKSWIQPSPLRNGSRIVVRRWRSSPSGRRG